MGIRVPTEAMLRRMDPEDRKSLGSAGVTFAEAQAKASERDERAVQKLIAQDLNRRDLFFWQSRMDKATRTRKGMPDFMIVLPGGRALAMEVKMPGGLISDDQQKVFTEYWDKTGEVVHIVLSFADYHALLNKHVPS